MKVGAKSSLASKANQLKTFNENILRDIKELSSINDSILSFWNGEDAKSLTTKLNNEVIPSLNKYYDCLEDYAEYLRKVYSVYSALEDAYNKNISV